MGLNNLFKKREALLAIDIGASAIKLVELDLGSANPALLNVAILQVQGDGSVGSKSDKIAENLTSLLQANQIGKKRVVTAVPGPSAFTKRVKLPKAEPRHLAASVELEAPNHIPHSLDAVKLDFHIIGESGRNQLDLLLVAVKNEVVDNLLHCFELVGLEVAIVDVDYFALQNVFEQSYPEYFDKTVALIDIGSRYSSINICRAGASLFAGDVSIGAKQISEWTAADNNMVAIDQEQSVEFVTASPTSHDSKISATQKAVNELNRQLSFFWNAAGVDGAIDLILLTGGAALTPGLLEELEAKTSLKCQLIDPFRGLECSEQIDSKYLDEIKPLMAVAVGLGLREPGDKIIPDYM